MLGAVIVAIISVVLFKLCEKEGTALGKNGAGEKSDKHPTEHDERYG